MDADARSRLTRLVILVFASSVLHGAALAAPLFVRERQLPALLVVLNAAPPAPTLSARSDAGAADQREQPAPQPRPLPAAPASPRGDITPPASATPALPDRPMPAGPTPPPAPVEEGPLPGAGPVLARAAADVAGISRPDLPGTIAATAPSAMPATGGPGGGPERLPAAGRRPGAGGGSVASLPGEASRGGPGTTAEPGADYAGYLQRLRGRIQEALEYPVAARRRGLAGTVRLQILVQPWGEIESVDLVNSSSHAILDAAALAAVRGLQPVPLPPDVPRRPIRVELPVVFDLR